MMTATIYSITEGFTLRCNTIAPDKSISHRSAMFSLLAKGESVVENFLRAEDTMNTLQIVKDLGARVEDNGSVLRISSNGIQEPFDILDCGNSENYSSKARKQNQ